VRERGKKEELTKSPCGLFTVRVAFELGIEEEVRV
jgi:hypothetical protein